MTNDAISTDITSTDKITGADLISWGHRPGRSFPDLLRMAETAQAQGLTPIAIRSMLDAELPPPPPPALPLQSGLHFHSNITAEDADEVKNVADVTETMRVLMQTPTIVAGAIMPDACPAGPLGTIPVGGVVAARNAIHPGMHSADICCSVMISDMGMADPAKVLDAATAVTHFGPGGRDNGQRFSVSLDLLDAFRANPFLNSAKMLQVAQSHMGTQGDGNHFLFVGRSRKTGRTAIVTHHGSRGPGAMLYRAGMEVAENYRRILSPATLKQNAWIPADSEDGRAYWDALQLIRRWTKANHNALHQAVVEKARFTLSDRFWNEHNFVFERGGLYYHGKGATPAWGGYAADANGLTLIPLNMAEPVLIVKGSDAPHALGFSPHGAGRNFSRTEHKRRMGGMTAEAMLKAETNGLDIRFHAGGIDPSELPSSYKRADAVVRQIKDYGLAEIEDYIDPYGCLMAGDVAPFWRTGKRTRR
ncbi:MAG: RtcB family protein [Cypionkella sp.]|uniref:RtcB family protein n=1 Tax=Cypionkella sp. TaxID=2811411 RepID=UPI002AB9DBF2|nr:RtcB family protein [Cypionkella sp.]MDZ4310888.1 RtcB family protein [Cypionkella sp.]